MTTSEFSNEFDVIYNYVITLFNSVYNEEKDEYYLQKVDVFAEAIQAIPAEAVKSSWKVSVDANGNITAVPQY